MPSAGGDLSRASGPASPRPRVPGHPRESRSAVLVGTVHVVEGGGCPVMAPVSPRQKSAYSLPSTSKTIEPSALSANTGNPPAHFIIQLIGTPPKSESPALT